MDGEMIMDADVATAMAIAVIDSESYECLSSLLRR